MEGKGHKSKSDKGPISKILKTRKKENKSI